MREEEERENMSIGKLGVMELHGNELCRTAEHGGASLNPRLKRLREEDPEFEDSLGYLAYSRLM